MSNDAAGSASEGSWITEKYGSVTLNGKLYLPISMVQELLKQQREICTLVGKHHKFGYYRYKKDEMLNAKSPLE